MDAKEITQDKSPEKRQPAAIQGDVSSVESSAAAVEVIEDEREQKQKRKYSSNLKGIQGIERDVSKALLRLTRAAETGVERWRDETDKSSRKKRDGAIRDAAENAAKAWSKGLRVASLVPVDASKARMRLPDGRYITPLTTIGVASGLDVA